MDSNCRSPVAKEVNPFREQEPSWSEKVRLEAVAYLPGTDSSNPSPSSRESGANHGAAEATWALVHCLHRARERPKLK
jgi:hypothetical protein